MRKFLLVLTSTALLATPALAEARGFKSDLPSTISGPIKLEIIVSDDLAHRANNLPKKLSDRGTGSRLNAAFSNNGYYGDREITYLLEEMEEELVQDFGRRGLTLSETAPTVLKVTIETVKPNRPTIKQLSKDTSLSFQSFGIGGAEISAEFLSASGESLGQASYDYFSNLNDRPFRQAGTWADANRAFSRFSNRLTKELATLDTTTS